MQSILNILNSDAGLTDNKEKVIDNRFKLLFQNVNSTKNKDDNFYSKLIGLLSDYINKLYDAKISDFPNTVFDENGKQIPQQYDTLDSRDKYNLMEANHEFSKCLFKYVCEILRANKDIKLDIETLKKLLNRNPKLLNLSVERDYLYRSLDFNELVKILNYNQTLKKSNISIDDIYQLLIDTCQINNSELFTNLVSPSRFKENHKKVDEFLTWCNARVFAEVTNIIVNKFDKDYDALTIAKNRKENHFCERIIINMLNSLNETNCNFIHQLLTEDNFSIDYNYDFGDYFGQTSLKDLLAFSGNRIIINDLLSKEENIESCYWHGESKIQLYRLYAILGNYQNALSNFNENYHYACDFTEDFPNGFNKEGYAHGDITYEDSLVAFIKNICNSLATDGLDDSTKNVIINSILNNENVQFINIDETLPTIQNTLSSEDFKTLVDSLIDKYNNGNLGFIVFEENDDSLFAHYIIRKATEEEIHQSFSSLNIEGSAKVLSLTRTKKDDSK